jgi:hypothetical protein
MPVPRALHDPAKRGFLRLPAEELAGPTILRDQYGWISRPALRLTTRNLAPADLLYDVDYLTDGVSLAAT